MKTGKRAARSLRLALRLLLLSTINYQLSTFSQGTVFTYQGRLSAAGTPANGNYDLRFALYDAASAGNQIGTARTNSPVAVSNGLFAVQLDFGNVFTGTNYWLDLGVRASGGGAFDPLTPRQPLTPAPYAIMANSASNLLGVFSGNGAGLTNVAGTLVWQPVSGTNQQAASKIGYVATNNNFQTVITLPGSPNLGDTIRVAGAGAGGWKLAQNAGQSILAGNLSGGVGIVWTVRASNKAWVSIASSADGTKLVAAANADYVYTSADSGLTWMPQTSSFTLSSVASSADGTKLVGAFNSTPSNDYLYTSTDAGLSWIARMTDANRTWSSVASSSDGTKLVAAVNGGQIFTSTNSGTNWTAHASSLNWISVASSTDGNNLVAAVNGGNIYSSTDGGATWTPRDSSRSWLSIASSSDGTRLVAAVNGGQIYTSINSATNWTPQNSGNRAWYSVASAGDGMKLAAVANGGPVYTSVDSGVTWMAQTNSGSRNWFSITSSADGTKLAAAVNGGQIYTSQPVSLSRTTAGSSGYLIGGQNTAIELQYIGNSLFMPISHEGTLFAY